MTGKGNVVASGRTVRHALRDGAGYSQEALSEALEGLTEPQIAKVEAVLAQARDRANGPAMKLALRDGVLTVTHEHENPAAGGVLLMADLGTCDCAWPCKWSVATWQSDKGGRRLAPRIVRTGQGGPRNYKGAGQPLTRPSACLMWGSL